MACARPCLRRGAARLAPGSDASTPGAAPQAAIFGYTMICIMPLNRQMLRKGGVEAEGSPEELRGLLRRWGRLHGTRTALGGAALGACLCGLGFMLSR